MLSWPGDSTMVSCAGGTRSTAASYYHRRTAKSTVAMLGRAGGVATRSLIHALPITSSRLTRLNVPEQKSMHLWFWAVNSAIGWHQTRSGAVFESSLAMISLWQESGKCMDAQVYRRLIRIQVFRAS